MGRLEGIFSSLLLILLVCAGFSLMFYGVTKGFGLEVVSWKWLLGGYLGGCLCLGFVKG